MSHTAYVAIGSNLGDRAGNYAKSIEKMGELPNTRVTGTSSRYESEPLGNARNWFLNGVVELTTELDAPQLLKALQKIETALGRKRDKSKKTVSRIIDLDIVLYEQETIETRNLKIPHPEMNNRRFVLMPLAELAPSMSHPVAGMTISTLLAKCKDEGKVMLYKERP